MQAIGAIADTNVGTVYYRSDGTRPPKRSEQEKTDYGAKRRCNSFLKTRFVPVAPVIVTRKWDGETYNYMTKENYAYLLKSALRYASLMGVELRHNPGSSIGEGIANLYDELEEAIGDIFLNIEPYEDRLQFILWKYHPWGSYTFYWLPVKFMETLNPKLRRIAHSFIHEFIHSNGIQTTNYSPDAEWVLESIRDNLHEYDPPEREGYQRLVYSYESGKIHRLMKRISSVSYYKNLPAALERYIPGNEFERALISVFREGLQFIGRDKPSIMSYGYDPMGYEEREEYPVDLDRMIRVIYDRSDVVTEYMEEWANTELRESYDISPATWLAISPLTTELFSMDRYPDDFFNWFNKLCTLII
jgi:hypothetical protein